MNGPKDYYVYILSNVSRTLYVGVTSDLERRMYEHREKLIDGFSKRYGLAHLVYYESTTDVLSAIAREKQLKGWLRRRKIELVESINPGWRDLSEDWGHDQVDSSLRSE